MPVYAYRRGQGVVTCMFSCEALLKAWPAARFSVWLHNQYQKGPAAPPYGHDSNEGKSHSGVHQCNGSDNPALPFPEQDTRLEIRV